MKWDNKTYELGKKIEEEKGEILSGTSYSFIIKGTLFVGGLESLKEEGYSIIFPIGYDTSPGPKEMYVYSTGLITISLTVDSETKNHEGKINFVDKVGEETIKDIKQGLEKTLRANIIGEEDPLYEILKKKLRANIIGEEYPLYDISDINKN